MNPPGRELWLSACISTGVHVTAVLVAAQLGAGALRRAAVRVDPPVLEVVVTEPKPVPTPPVPLPVASATPPAAPAAAAPARDVVAETAEAKLPPVSVTKPPPPNPPPPVVRTVTLEPPKSAPSPPPPPPVPKLEQPAVVPRVVSTAGPPKPSAPVVPAAPVQSPTIVKNESASPPQVVAAAGTTVATAPPPSGITARGEAGTSAEGTGTLALPQYRSNPAPVYPESARRQRQEGVVWLRVEVSERGDALAVAVGQSSGHLALDEAAMSAVRDWKFVPARQGTRPVAARVEVPVRFRLGN